MEEPKFMAYCIWNDKGCQLKDDAPEWAKKDYKEWFKDNEPDEFGVITEY